MNRPSRNDDGNPHPGWNQSPPALAAELTTRSDLNGIANSRSYRGHKLGDRDPDSIELDPVERSSDADGCKFSRHAFGKLFNRHHKGSAGPQSDPSALRPARSNDSLGSGSIGSKDTGLAKKNVFGKTGSVLAKYAKFVGPGAMISVAYIDPGNYATDVAAGASYRFKLLFMVLLSNIFAIFLQSLCIKLGSVTGLNLAQMCKEHTPKWLNLVLYAFAEAAIIATDIAEVIGTAIALNLLFNLPLVAGCAISIVDVLVILFFYRPSGSVRGLRAFELFVMALVLGVVICFCFQLSLIRDTSVGEVFRGYIPSSALVESQGLYQSCGILGATVMPHSLYLGSGMVQPRLLEYDTENNHLHPSSTNSSSTSSEDLANGKYRPSLPAIRSCMSYSIAELAISLFTFALFVNSAILIIAGASLSNSSTSAAAASASLFGIHTLLSEQLAKAAGVVFALALLLSGTSAGIVCTIAGQMVSEGQLSWSVRPWIRRLVTRSISITPSIIIAGAVGAEGLSTALEASQVALSVILPIVSAPLIYFTCRAKYMTVVAVTPELPESGPTPPARQGAAVAETQQHGEQVDQESPSHSPANHEQRRETESQQQQHQQNVNMRNHWVTAVFAVLIWLVIVIMNGAAIVLLGLGVGD